MNKNDGLMELPNLVCPACATVMNYGAFLQNAKPQVKKGDFFICAACAAVNRMGDSSLHVVSKAELETLDPQTQLMLKVAVDSVKSKQDSPPEIIKFN